MTKRTPAHLVKTYPRIQTQETLRKMLNLCPCGREPSAGYITCSICIEYAKESKRRATGKRECMVCHISSMRDICQFCTQEMRSGEHQWQKRNRRAA